MIKIPLKPRFMPYDYCLACIFNDSRCEHCENTPSGLFCFLYGKYLNPLNPLSLEVKL